ncbi:hypothetical protein SAY87_014689 [Trapa incisa]|uniref:Uncharacterized protein n=2 Tax=Trapa TaxID=22665 RepID=A0AAN7RLP9_TRANT|nr:hypothetical protein SAY87_014689 [Trapa incisa]KAK4802501.1 hypothetical protein SAY86_000704 [Trapa natans]
MAGLRMPTALLLVSALVLVQRSLPLEARKTRMEHGHNMPSHFHLPSGGSEITAFPAAAAVLPHWPVASDGRVLHESVPSPAIGN